MYNFGRRHHEEQFCEFILNSNQWLRRRCHLKAFLSRVQAAPSFGGANLLCNLKEEIMRKNSVNLFECGPVVQKKMWFKDISNLE